MGTAAVAAASCACVCIDCIVTSILLVIVMLVAAYSVVLPLRITAEDASLSHLALAGPNGTALAAYNLTLTVGLFNPNWAMRAELTTPLEAELTFAGVRLDGSRLSDAGRRIEIHETVRFRVEADAQSEEMPLGSDELAEFVKESAAGVFESLELKLTGRLRYRPVHAGGTRRLEARCPLKLRMAPPPGTHMLVLDKQVIKCHRL